MSTSEDWVAPRWLLFVTVCVVLSGCFGSRVVECDAPEEITTTENRAPITVPGDLDALDESKALKVPEATSPPPREGHCLERPPKYFEDG